MDAIRNSAGTFLNRRSDPVISRLNDRLSHITRMPVSHQEDLQVLRYFPGEHYYPHTDFFSTPVERSEANGKQRYATILTYLNDYGVQYTGGETIMPLLPPTEAQKSWTNVTECTTGKLAVRPKKGSALMFYSMNENGDELSSSTHGSCDVLTGVKYSAPTWIRQLPFHPSSLPPAGPFICKDGNQNCPNWATQGECTKNPQFMAQTCMLSCKLC